MATLQQQLVCDSSTITNFKEWAQAISSAFSTFGWVQSSDSGQVNWSTIATVPGSNSYVYEIWEPNDGLTNFYVKVEYGNTNNANSPGMRLSLGTGTNGAGTLTGTVLGPLLTTTSAYTPPSNTTQYECNFSGALGRIGVMMWRNGGNNCQMFFAIERAVNASGSYTGSYVTLWTTGNNGATLHGSYQATLVFGVGTTPLATTSNYSNSPIVRYIWLGGSSSAFNGSIPMDTCSPCVGYFDSPCTAVGVALAMDISEGAAFTVTLYGATRTYLPSANGQFRYFGPAQSAIGSVYALCMRYD